MRVISQRSFLLCTVASLFSGIPFSPASLDLIPQANTRAFGQEQSGRVTVDEPSSGQPLVEKVLEWLTHGPAFEAKLRQRVWAAGREVVEVGRYEQAGRGTGWFRMELQVPIADDKGRWQQTSDGRLVWTREELAGELRFRRVDLGKLEESSPRLADRRLADVSASQLMGNSAALGVSPGNWSGKVPPRLRVGGLAEIMDRLAADYDLVVSEGHIEGVPMVVLKGALHAELCEEMGLQGNSELAELVPQHVRVAIPLAKIESPLPARIEFWSRAAGRLISLLEIYDMTIIESPPVERFQFDVGLVPAGNDPVVETDLYLRRFGLGS